MNDVSSVPSVRMRASSRARRATGASASTAARTALQGRRSTRDRRRALTRDAGRRPAEERPLDGTHDEPVPRGVVEEVRDVLVLLRGQLVELGAAADADQ